MSMSFNQLKAGILGNVASSCWFLPMGANVLHYLRGVQMKKPFSIYFARDVIIDNRVPGEISIGANCIFAPRSVVMAHASIPVGNRMAASDEIVKPVVVGDNVFVGANAIILPGSVLGDGCFVAAGSVVLGHFLPNTLIAGNPARPKRSL